MVTECPFAAGEKLSVTFDMTVHRLDSDGRVIASFDGEDPAVWPGHMLLIGLPRTGPGATVERKKQ